MSRWRILLVSLLITLPFLTLAGLGSYFLWQQNYGLIYWWPMTGLTVAGLVLAWYWQRKQQLLRPVDFDALPHWTDRDREAWHLVEARARDAAGLDPTRLMDIQFYLDTARDMALEIARFYHPNARDPLDALTLPEILAVVELASRDLAEMVDEYVPGGHLMSINNWRQAKRMSDWYRTANNIYWVISAVFSPVNTGLRYLASQAGVGQPLQMLQNDLLAWFYTAYLQRVGTYLIDLHSGRLRVGARRYRELMQALAPGSEPGTAEGVPPARQVGLTITGQVKAGKSSFINALLGEQRAQTDVLPATAEVTRYELQPPGISSKLVLFDTVGYGHTGPREDQLRATEESARQSDLIVLVLHARNPARQADLEMLRGLRAWFAEQPELKLPPILGVLTHIDLLSPALEWAPPYNWAEPQRPKEQQIQQAVAALREQLGEYLVGVVPLCTAAGKVYGIDEWFLPILMELLDEAHAVALLRCIRAEANARKVRRVFEQLLAVGAQAARILWATYRR